MPQRACTLIALAALGGCGGTIEQRVSPVATVDSKEICVIENSRVRASFLEAYQRALQASGFAVRLLPESAPLSACSITSRYVAHWQWDIALYLAIAELRVYKDGLPAGQALYNATRAAATTSKFVNAEEKVKELVQQLFPAGGKS